MNIDEYNDNDKYLGKVSKKRIYLGLCPKHRTLPTHRARLGLH